jgi:hypothetical protein
MRLSNLGSSLRIPSVYKSGSWIRNRSQTAISTSSYSGIGDLPGVASADQTNHLLHVNPTVSAASYRKSKMLY